MSWIVVRIAMRVWHKHSWGRQTVMASSFHLLHLLAYEMREMGNGLCARRGLGLPAKTKSRRSVPGGLGQLEIAMENVRLSVIGMILMTPLKVSVLIIPVQFAKVAIGAVRLDDPLIVISALAVIPNVIVTVGRIVRAVRNPSGAAGAHGNSSIGGEN
jgi:hypothetical protein